MKINTKDMRHKVLRIVAQYPKAAKDDKYLIALIWQEEGWDYGYSLYANLCRVSSPETIRRTRQKLCQEGMIKVDEKTLDGRYKDFKEARESLIW